MTSRSLPDAPALRAANVGVAMGKSGSDLARKTAHIVLTDDNFVSIVAAVREGRRIIHSIKKFLVMALTANIGMAILLVWLFETPLAWLFSLRQRWKFCA